MVQMLMNNLQRKNPQEFQQLNAMMQQGANPDGIIKQMMNNASSQEIQQVFQQAKQMGVPDDVLQRIQNFRY